MPFKTNPPDDSGRNFESKGQNSRGTIVSKSLRSVQFEYIREKKLIYILDRDATVRDYVSQPELIQYFNNRGKLKDYWPDFKVERTDGSMELHQVMKRTHRLEPDMQERERVMHELCARRGWRYKVHEAEKLMSDTEYANLSALYCYRAQMHANSDVERAVTARLAGGKQLPIDDLSQAIASEVGITQGHAVAAFYRMLWYGNLCVNLTNRLIIVFAHVAPGILVWLPETNSSGETS